MMSAEARQLHNNNFAGNWMWLFPVAYLGHIVEEHLAGFNEWIESLWHVESSDAYFLIWNFAAALGMVVGVLLVLKTRSYRWLIVGFGVSVLGNGLLHASASISARAYTPGLITSIAFWFPLAAITIWRARAVKMNRRCFIAGVIFGIVANIVILLLVFSLPRLFSA